MVVAPDLRPETHALSLMLAVIAASGAPLLLLDGDLKVIAASADTQEEALRLYDALRAAGYAAEIRPAMRGEKRIYDVRLAHLPSKAEAEALAGSIRGKMGVAAPKVSM